MEAHGSPLGSCRPLVRRNASWNEGLHPKLLSILPISRASTLASIKCGSFSATTSLQSFRRWPSPLFWPHGTSLSASLSILACLHRCICSSSGSAHSMKQPLWYARQVWAWLQSADGQRETAKVHPNVWPPEIRKIPTCWWPPSPRNFPTRAELYEDLRKVSSQFLTRFVASRGCTSWHPGFAPIRLALPAARNPPHCGGETASQAKSDLRLAGTG